MAKPDAFKLAEKTARDYEKEREYRRNKAIIAYEEARKKRSTASKITSAIFGAVRAPKQTFARVAYGTQMAPVGYAPGRAASGIKTGRRGRPRGTVKYSYNGQPIGVYEYRKILAAKLREQRLRAQRQYAVTPAQEQLIRQAQMRQQAMQQDPERQVIPDTSGRVPMQGYQDEIDRAVGLVD